MLREAGVNCFVHKPYNYYKGDYQPTQLYKARLNTEDTYVSVFGPSQNEQLEFIKTHKDIKIIFESAKACNRNYRTGPRNTVVVWELLNKD